MIKPRKFLVPSLILASSLLAMNIAVHAESGHGDKKCDKDKKHAAFGEHRGFSEGRFLERKLSKLDLSGEQQTQVKQIVDKQKPVLAEKRQALHASFKALASASANDQYDQKKVQEIASEQAKLQADLLVLRSNTLHEVYQVLTPEQKQKWAEFQSKVRPKHDEKA
ncbi:Spy/CpxP family protein refolding chaperone [Methylobacillus sp. Pita2]|uniref:Spy/CpxP family protein refolding chaperone n=1 Tax=Methylobacillus TaxID=404 RepID=UPI0012D29C34|nr:MULTISPECIES: Spy/CpxP family protein refolding chaperone [Methylobacillus]MDR5170791.1 Spy/CpxP family protein refolding chaperone [Methylobacillus flagellatus]MPS49644.1 periplasmic heavy metal sensor [Methylobacillus sp.]